MKLAPVLLIAASLLALQPARADETALSPAQKIAVESLIKQYITDHPEVIGEALLTLQAKQQQTQESMAASSIANHRKDIFDDGQNTVVVNPKGDVTLVEFLDYNCGYCKAELPRIVALTKRDPGVRLVIKEFPILGPTSVLAARWALAAREQGKYAEFHQAAMAHKGAIGEESLAAMASKLGLNVANLKAAANGAGITATIKANYELADALGISGTPAIVIGDSLIPGAVPMETLEAAIAEARKK